jgi:hypothetical protein
MVRDAAPHLFDQVDASGSADFMKLDFGRPAR